METLFFDFDECLVSTKEATIAYINEVYQLSLSQEEFYCGNSLHTVVNQQLPEEEQLGMVEFYEDFGKNFLPSYRWHQGVLPLEGSTEVVPSLAEKYLIWVVTARQARGAQVVEDLLNMFFPHCISGVHYVTQHHEDGSFVKVPKAEFLQHYPGEKVAFVDDNPDEITQTTEIIPSYLLDPHGFHNETKIHKRVQSWEEIGSILL